MNKIKEFLKKTRLTSWHIYSVTILYMIFTFVIDGYLYGYTGYLESRTQLTVSEFESLLSWLAIISLLMIVDVISSAYVWYKESKEEK